jgi:hypothetical protein
MPAPDSILQLVENFELQRRAYLSYDYNETQVQLIYADRQIDELVYGWTEVKVRVVEVVERVKFEIQK